jgi:Flp pilus assembly protein TadG
VRKVSAFWTTRLCCRERGASAVEFALIAPVFFMLCFGLFTGALAFNQKNELTHASRDGARYGVTLAMTQSFDLDCNPVSSGGTLSGSCWAQNVAMNTRNNAFGNLDTTVPGNHVCVAVVRGANTLYSDINGTYWYDSNGGSPAPCFDDGGADLSVRVQVSSSRNSFINAVLFRMNFTLHSEATAQIETQPTAGSPPP